MLELNLNFLSLKTSPMEYRGKVLSQRVVNAVAR
jgi:hypothetical protein